MPIAGSVVVLNGPPAAGKRAIAERVQQQADLAFIGIGIHFFYAWMLPPRRAGEPLGRATHRRYLEAMHRTIAAHARSGCNVIVDHTLLDVEWQRELASLLEGLDVVWVEVGCDDALLRQRESAHGRRPEGSGTALKAEMSSAVPVDLAVDGGDADAAARSILHYLRTRSMRRQPLARWVPGALPRPSAEPGLILALIGSSSAGKSTLCRGVQTLAEQRSGEHYLYMGIDTGLATLPERYVGIPFHADQMEGYEAGADGRLGFSFVAPGPSEDNPSPYPQQQCGPVARVLISGQLNSIAALSRAGFNVVGDHIWVFRDWHDEARYRYEGLPVQWISVTCSDAVLDAHERQRGDRLPGFGLGQRAQMFEGGCDFTIDTGALTPEEEAARILDLVEARRHREERNG